MLLLLFAGSGCSALIYEIVWYQLLQLVIGSSAVSLGVLLATFMGGLCLGSLLLPRLKLGRQHPLRVYGKLELGIGACGILVLFLMPLVDSVYTSAVGHGMPAILLRALVSGLCLLPPTFLMGASLPAASRWIKASPEGVGMLGMLYGANTVGAVIGCLLAGFYLLRVFDMATATFVAAAINVTVGLVSFSLAKRAPEHKSADEARPAIAAGAWPVYVTIALSGATALGAEVVWTRLLGLMLGATVYTFSIILAVFLVGIGIGSAGGSMLVRGARNPKALLGWSQMLLAGAVAWTAYMLSHSLPYWPINPLLSTSPWYTFQIDMVRCLWALLPAALLWGASFPLALAAAASEEGDPGRLVGGIYAANTGGAIVGALCASMILVPWIGTGPSQAVLIAALGGQRIADAGPAVAALPFAERAGHGRGGGHRCAAGAERLAGAGHADRLRAAHDDVDGPLRGAVHGRRHQLLDCDHEVGRRRGSIPRQRQGGGLDGVLRHAPAAHAGAPAGAGAQGPEIGADRGLRRGRHGGSRSWCIRR